MTQSFRGKLFGSSPKQLKVKFRQRFRAGNNLVMFNLVRAIRNDHSPFNAIRDWASYLLTSHLGLLADNSDVWSIRPHNRAGPCCTRTVYVTMPRSRCSPTCFPKFAPTSFALLYVSCQNSVQHMTGMGLQVSFQDVNRLALSAKAMTV